MDTTQATSAISTGDILVASYCGNSKHNYWLLVTKRTAKTVNMVRLEREIVSDDGYGQNGEEKPLIVNGQPVISKFHEAYNNKRIKIGYNGTECAKVGDYISYAEKWDGVHTESFYTD